MEPITLAFDEIPMIRRVRSIKVGPAHTVFSFVSQSTLTRDVIVPGHPRLVPGMRVSALLRTKGNWRTLVGWVDLETGTIQGPSPKSRLARMTVPSGLLVALYLFWVYLDSSHPGSRSGQGLAVGFMSLVWLLVLGIELRAYYRDRSDLKALSRLAGE